MAANHGPQRKRAISMSLSPSYLSHIHEIDTQACDKYQPSDSPDYANFESKAAMNNLFHTLRVHHIDVSSMIFERFKLTLLNMQTSAERRKILHRLLKQSLQVSNDELNEVLRMRNVMQWECPPSIFNNDRAHRFYIRSWVFTPLQLLSVVRLLRERGFTSTTLDEWGFQSCIAFSGNLTVRYIVHSEAAGIPCRALHNENLRATDENSCKRV